MTISKKIIETLSNCFLILKEIWISIIYKIKIIISGQNIDGQQVAPQNLSHMQFSLDHNILYKIELYCLCFN
jgi:hypothetical protein